MSPGASPYRAARSRSMSMRTVGWPSERNTPRSAMPGTVAITSLILFAVLSSVSRSPPNNFTEFSPFTPDAASSTLSSMYCEKLKSTPGNASFRRSVMSSVSFSLSTPRRPRVERLQRDEKLGVEKAGRVGPVIRPAVLRYDRDDLGITAEDRTRFDSRSVRRLPGRSRSAWWRGSTYCLPPASAGTPARESAARDRQAPAAGRQRTQGQMRLAKAKRTVGS